MQNNRKTAVMIVSDHPIMRDGLRLRVQQERDLHVVCEANDVKQTIYTFRRYKPDIALIDLQSPRGAGLLAMNAIRGLSPQTPLVVLTNYPGDVDTSPRAGEGPTFAVSRTLVSEQIIAAIRAALVEPV
jgi:two-component system, NarL family, response regulator